jgi:hypothetical protein
MIVCVLWLPPSVLVQTSNASNVFEIEIPEFAISPVSTRELTIPSLNFSQIVIHVLKPAADNIDYSAIRTSLNGQATATIAEVLSGPRGKVIRLNLKFLPGFALVAGRNTIEVWAQNRRNRAYYASFVLRTATANRNEAFAYQVEPGSDAKNAVPPELVLLEPEGAVQVSPARRGATVRISGIATAATSVKKVSIDGKPVTLVPGNLATKRGLGLANEDNKVAFETTVSVKLGTTRIIVEAEDSSGTRTRLTIPVIRADETQATEFRGNKYALLIGVSRYKNNAEGIPDLKYADVDARSVYQFLQQPVAGKFSKANMLLLENEQATISNIRQALSSFVSHAEADDLLLIFIAGHGAPDPAQQQNLYVLAHDTTLGDMANTALAMPDLRKYVERNVRAKRVVLLVDTCHSAGLSAEITRALSNNLVNLYFEKLLYQEEGRAIITSSDVNEFSRESERWGAGHGVFTYYILEGLKGKANVNEDQLVSVGELFRFVRQKVRLDTEFKQNPRMLVGANENLALSLARPQK